MQTETSASCRVTSLWAQPSLGSFGFRTAWRILNVVQIGPSVTALRNHSFYFKTAQRWFSFFPQCQCPGLAPRDSFLMYWVELWQRSWTFLFIVFALISMIPWDGDVVRPWSICLWCLSLHVKSQHHIYKHRGRQTDRQTLKWSWCTAEDEHSRLTFLMEALSKLASPVPPGSCTLTFLFVLLSPG